MEVPSCKLGAVVASDLSWPWAVMLVGCTLVTSLQLFPALLEPEPAQCWLWGFRRSPHPQLVGFCCEVTLSQSHRCCLRL